MPTRIPLARSALAPIGWLALLVIGCADVEMSDRSEATISPAPVVAADKSEEPAVPSAEAYATIVENDFRKVAKHPLSTFSIDVDTASYANVRRFLDHDTLPPRDAVRIEELVNYFPYDDAAPRTDDPFAVKVEVSRCPWQPEHRLARIVLKGKEPDRDARPATNLVFLIDVSGSMDTPQKLPLLKAALGMMVKKLGENDRVGIVVYASRTGVVLSSTTCDRKSEILAALEELSAGGSTNGGAGIQLAYEMAVGNFLKGGVNRVILATDGDFNVGITDRGDLIRLIEKRARSGVFLSVLGFGMGNLKDATLEQLADKGNGNYAYIDTPAEARKVLVEQLGATLITIAKDVKIQVEFNPAKVGAYRLIGYENRLLRDRDFRDDSKDAGEIGAGHTVTALYELVPAGQEGDDSDLGVRPLKYQAAATPETAVKPSQDLMTVSLRYKEPDGDASKQQEVSVVEPTDEVRPSDDFRFAASVAAFGMLLRDSPHKGKASYGAVLEEAESSLGSDRSGYRKQFLDLVRKAQTLSGR